MPTRPDDTDETIPADAPANAPPCTCPGCNKGEYGKAAPAEYAVETVVVDNGVRGTRLQLLCREHARDVKGVRRYTHPSAKSAEEVAGAWGNQPGARGARG